MRGFAIGPTTNPCTKGIWIWSDPVELDSKTVMLILDTEGLFSVRKWRIGYKVKKDAQINIIIIYQSINQLYTLYRYTNTWNCDKKYFIPTSFSTSYLERDQTLDMKIFSISLLLGSMFVYNQIGHIDE